MFFLFQRHSNDLPPSTPYSTLKRSGEGKDAIDLELDGLAGVSAARTLQKVREYRENIENNLKGLVQGRNELELPTDAG